MIIKAAERHITATMTYLSATAFIYVTKECVNISLPKIKVWIEVALT